MLELEATPLTGLADFVTVKTGGSGVGATWIVTASR
jgi:hypothetical protein